MFSKMKKFVGFYALIPLYFIQNEAVRGIFEIFKKGNFALVCMIELLNPRIQESTN